MIRNGTISFVKSAQDTVDLVCPRCGSEYLHQVGATFYDRSEDAEMTTVTRVMGGEFQRREHPSTSIPNPSARRHGMAIVFECEGCSEDDGPLELTVAQHKGNTEMGWRYPSSSR